MSLINLAKRTTSVASQLLRYQTFNCSQKINSMRFSSSEPKPDDVNKILLEFFDTKSHWGENEVKHGRCWSLPELRIKSNTDLHKLWYILLKEKNMLLTMEHEALEENRLFASPERLDKVKESMSNLELVVRERNRAYHELETGETGERPGRMVSNQLGMRYFYRSAEHIIPYFMNTKWREERKFRYGGHAVSKFMKLYREKLWNEKRKSKNRDRNEVVHVLRRNPDLDRNMLQSKFPGVNIERLEKLGKIQGHFVPKM